MTERKCEWLDGEELLRLVDDACLGRYNGWKKLSDFIRARFEEERKDEREACIKCAEDERLFEPQGEEDIAYDTAIEHVAKAIRARGGEK